MIDRVQKVLEWMAPELNSYKKRRIFNQKQIQKIIENRRKFENKLQRNNKKLTDFLAYIESEKNLEKIRNKKIKDTGLEETDLLLQSNIIKIYQRALHYYNEPILLKEFSEYCIKRKAIEELKNTFAEKCLKNVTDTDMWVYCAQKLWEIGDIEDARNLFIKGTSVNFDSKLYIEFFRLECLYANKLNNINAEFGVKDEEKDDIEMGKIALAVFNNFKNKLNTNEINQCLEISNIIQGLRESIIDSLENK